MTWDPAATEELQRIYDTAIGKEGIINAVTRVGLELEAVPLEAGESRDENSRILFKCPLICWFRINERLHEVAIVRVASFFRGL